MSCYTCISWLFELIPIAEKDVIPTTVWQGFIKVFWEWYFWYNFGKFLIDKLPFGNKNKEVRMKTLGILHDFRTFFIGKGSFYRTLRKIRKIPVWSWPHDDPFHVNSVTLFLCIYINKFKTTFMYLYQNI